MDWFKGKFSGNPIFNRKIYGFRLNFSLKPIHWDKHWQTIRSHGFRGGFQLLDGACGSCAPPLGVGGGSPWPPRRSSWTPPLMLGSACLLVKSHFFLIKAQFCVLVISHEISKKYCFCPCVLVKFQTLLEKTGLIIKSSDLLLKHFASGASAGFPSHGGTRLHQPPWMTMI